MKTNEVLVDAKGSWNSDDGIKEGDEIVIPEPVAVDNHSLHKKLLVAFAAGGITLAALNVAVPWITDHLHRGPTTEQVLDGLRAEHDGFVKWCKEQNGWLSIDGYARTTCTMIHSDERFEIPAPVEIREFPTQYTDWDADKHGREGGHYDSERRTP